MTMRISLLFPAFALAFLASVVWYVPAHSQWSLAAEVGADRFWGGSIQNTEERRSFRPYRPTTFGIGFERRRGRFGVGLRLRYALAGLALEGADAVVAVKGVFKVYSAAPEIVYRIATVGAGNKLVLHAGPLLELWRVGGEDSQSRVGVAGALSLNVPLGGRFTGSLTAGGALIPSPFSRDQLDDNFERSALWRRRVAAGLQYRL